MIRPSQIWYNIASNGSKLGLQYVSTLKGYEIQGPNRLWGGPRWRQWNIFRRKRIQRREVCRDVLHNNTDNTVYSVFILIRKKSTTRRRGTGSKILRIPPPEAYYKSSICLRSSANSASTRGLLHHHIFDNQLHVVASNVGDYSFR